MAILGRWEAGGADGCDDRAVAGLLLAPVVQAAVTGRPATGRRTAAEVVARALERATTRV